MLYIHRCVPSARQCMIIIITNAAPPTPPSHPTSPSALFTSILSRLDRSRSLVLAWDWQTGARCPCTSSFTPTHTFIPTPALGHRCPNPGQWQQREQLGSPSHVKPIACFSLTSLGAVHLAHAGMSAPPSLPPRPAGGYEESSSDEGMPPLPPSHILFIRLIKYAPGLIPSHCSLPSIAHAIRNARKYQLFWYLPSCVTPQRLPSPTPDVLANTCFPTPCSRHFNLFSRCRINNVAWGTSTTPGRRRRAEASHPPAPACQNPAGTASTVKARCE